MRIQNLLLGGLFCCAASATAGSLSIDESKIDFGEKYQFNDVQRDVRIWNKSAAMVRLHDIKPSRLGATATLETHELGPYSSTTMHISIQLQDKIGYVSTRLQLEADENGTTDAYDFIIAGYVNSILNEDPSLDLGIVDVSMLNTGKSIRLTSAIHPDLRILRVIDAPEFVETKVGQAGNELLVTPRKLDALGFHKGVIKVAVDSPEQSQVWINVLMELRGDVVPDQNPLAFGMQRPSTIQPQRLQLTSRTGKAFRVGKITISDTAHVRVAETRCLPKIVDSCHAYLLTINKDHRQGELSGKVSIDLPDTRQVVNVELAGLFLEDSTVVQELGVPREAQAGGTRSTTAKMDIGTSIKRAVNEVSQSAPAGTGPLLKWQIANEAAIYGYAIYRGDSADGHFVRVNDAIIKAENGGDGTTANYQWRDTTAQKGREYWYYITIFNNNGTKTQLTGPQKVVAK